MTTKTINGVYLTGWEYNRFLSKDPTRARNSALPATILWKGAHQLWMFEDIYVTKEASANEHYATEALGWIMGDVLTFLRDEEKALRVLDWSQLAGELQESIQEVRRRELTKLKAKAEKMEASSELGELTLDEFAHEVLMRAIRSNSQSELERLKHMLLAPVLDHYGCLASGAPTNLEWWISQVAGDSSSGTLEAELQGLITQPLIPGVVACRCPATMGSAFRRQQKVVTKIETPRIVDLIAGIGEFADPEAGYEPYVDALKPYRADYEEVNNAMRDDWNKNRDHIKRLRDAARDHLWPHLHNEWLPRARAGDENFVRKEFPRLIRSALLAKPFTRYLDHAAIKVSIGFVTAYGLSAGTHLASHELGVPPELTEAGAATGASLLGAKYGAYAKQAWNLGIFYQRTRAS